MQAKHDVNSIGLQFFFMATQALFVCLGWRDTTSIAHMRPLNAGIN